MLAIQKLFPSLTGRFINKEVSMSRMFRATFLDSFSRNTIVVEFEAPFPVDLDTNYEKLATQRLGEMITSGEIKVRDIEPIETI
jgi:hypothetical protein